MVMNQQQQMPCGSMDTPKKACEQKVDLPEVRILLVGDRNVGKTSIVMCLLYDGFCEQVPSRCETVLIPRNVSADGVLTQITDYSAREQSEEELEAMIREANVICVVYSVTDSESINRVTSYWLPLIQRILGGADHNCSILLAANKSDRENETTHIEKMVPIMNDYLEIETVVECSAKIAKNISEIFYYAQKAVIYPFRPLFSVEEKRLSMKCQKALARIFKLCDSNNDGLLTDDELKEFQMISFGVPLTSAAVEEVKQVISEHDHGMVIDNALTLEGFLYLHQMFIQRGRHETVWTVLKRFGYDLHLQLRQDYLLPKVRIPKGSSTEPSNACLQFITKLFRKYDEDCDECLSTSELQSLFSVCPSNPWTEDMLHSVELNQFGWITYTGFVNLWTLNFALNLSQALEQLAYLGFNVEYGTQLEALEITQDRRKDIAEKSTKRRVFKCQVIGPKDAGKTVFCRSFVGKRIQEVSRMNKRQLSPYVINNIVVKSETKHLILHEVDVYSQNDLLSSQERSADVVCLLYDSTNPNSFAYCAHIYLRHFYRMKLPCLFVATKAGLYEVAQEYEYQPSDFCQMHQLPKPLYFHDIDIGNPAAEVYSALAKMAIYPHMKSLLYVRDNHNLLNYAAALGIGGLVLLGLFAFKGVGRG